ncbi:hypothetical protein M3221_19250 [Domibacillus indicus]|uniref:hypothetical protein n=1 Tax=Domibacillus indicus TaxID=1437523 RepID=UPI00203DD287|nr:hypothetical protein [Domibacillus indicus]MCM3790504.1 hypothetical protein [Domibacillus indicus]
MEEGFHNLYGNHVQLYVLNRENFADFLMYMKTHHRYEIIKQDYLLKRAVFEENGCQKQQSNKEEEAGQIPYEMTKEYRQIWS